jgi:hypothetical protein
MKIFAINFLALLIASFGMLPLFSLGRPQALSTVPGGAAAQTTNFLPDYAVTATILGLCIAFALYSGYIMKKINDNF